MKSVNVCGKEDIEQREAVKEVEEEEEQANVKTLSA